MRIAIPVEEKREDANISDRFARAPFFVIYDESTGEIEYYENTDLDAHGMGPKTTRLLADNKVNVLITKDVGANALTALQGVGIEIYQAISGSAKENLNAWKESKLNKF
ncbi:MAG: NifB/NifX family molybdenum-iron cluster-binding protein [Thermotogae bacterium]|nr:NifB/NifX family molybdenum-iron cluster-binding protein [Thermotogota bacterium]